MQCKIPLRQYCCVHPMEMQPQQACAPWGVSLTERGLARIKRTHPAWDGSGIWRAQPTAGTPVASASHRPLPSHTTDRIPAPCRSVQQNYGSAIICTTVAVLHDWQSPQPVGIVCCCSLSPLAKVAWLCWLHVLPLSGALCCVPLRC